MKDGWNEGRKEGKKGGGKLTKYIKIINWIAKKKKSLLKIAVLLSL